MATSRNLLCALILSFLLAEIAIGQPPNQTGLCLDGFCIGQSLNDPHFDQVKWILPKDGFTKKPCNGIGCKPQVAFRGYATDDQNRLAEALSWEYGLMQYNLITDHNLAALRLYKYECNPSPRGINGDRRFLGAYRSVPSQYLTVVGLRLIAGELRIYRIARQYPYHNQTELTSLARKLRDQYGDEILLYDALSSNAFSEVIEQKRNGWFGRSTSFNPTDMADNAAELVLIDPKTRPLLEPTSIPESGEIQPLPVRLPEKCSVSIPVN